MAKQGLKWFFSHRGSVWKWILNKCEAWICNSAPSAWYENCSTCVTGSKSPASCPSLSLASALFTLLKDDKQQLNCEGLCSLNIVLVLNLWLRFTGQPCKEVHRTKGSAASPLSAQNRPACRSASPARPQILTLISSQASLLIQDHSHLCGLLLVSHDSFCTNAQSVCCLWDQK